MKTALKVIGSIVLLAACIVLKLCADKLYYGWLLGR